MSSLFIEAVRSHSSFGRSHVVTGTAVSYVGKSSRVVLGLMRLSPLVICI